MMLHSFCTHCMRAAHAATVYAMHACGCAYTYTCLCSAILQNALTPVEIHVKVLYFGIMSL